MDRYETYYRTLYSVARVVNSSLDPAKVLEEIAQAAAQAMNAKACTLRLLDRTGEHLLASATFGLSKAYLRKGPIDVAKSGLDREVLAGQVVTIKDVAADARFQYPEQAKAEGIHSILVAPLSVEGKAIGVLRIYDGKVREFDPAEVEFLTAIADLSALAIENARLHQALKKDYDMLAAFEHRIFED
jgi:GAF domain-containing protein